MSKKKKKRKNHKKIHSHNLGVHDGIVRNLEQRLNESPINWKVKTHIEYGKKSRCNGEIDIYATATINYKTYFLDIEVKSNDKQKARHKAYHQLKRAYNTFCNKYDRCIMMYAYKDKGKIEIERMYIR